MNLEAKLKNNSAIIGIVGLGYVGLPLAVDFAEAGLSVIGFDSQPERVHYVNSGKSYIADISSKQLSKLVNNGQLLATNSYGNIRDTDAICICVPTPLTKTKEPDLSYVTSVSENLSSILKRGQLVVLESTTYPGTTRELIQPILERSGLKAGTDFYLAFSPERVDPGSKKYNIGNTPKVVGGIDQKSTKVACALYQKVTKKIVPVSSSDVAEMTKLFENIYRSVNIALVNELALLCENMGISIWEVVEAASTKPFGFQPFYPGSGVGGHCIPLDPYYLASKAREYTFHTRFIELAAEINEGMPHHIAYKVGEGMNRQRKGIQGTKILVLGVAYKKDVSDTRESPCLKLIEILQNKGSDVSYNDPYVPSIKVSNHSLASEKLSPRKLTSYDCVVIATDHSDYNYEDIIKNSKLVFDATGVTKNISDDKKIFRLGE